MDFLTRKLKEIDGMTLPYKIIFHQQYWLFHHYTADSDCRLQLPRQRHQSTMHLRRHNQFDFIICSIVAYGGVDIWVTHSLTTR